MSAIRVRTRLSGRGSPPRSLRARLLGGVATGAVIACWFCLAPASIGGDYRYVVVQGNSMEPHLSSGDFVLLRREQRYGLGEVVAYRDPLLGPVLHRLRAREGERFSVQGDNRERPDAYAPLPSDILGREAGVWHRGLAVVLALTSPLALAALATAVIAFGVAAQQHAARSRPRFRRLRNGFALAWMRR